MKMKLTPIHEDLAQRRTAAPYSTTSVKFAS
jgi:hypothetical protein